MFEMFSNVWTPVLPISEIGAAPVAIELAGELLVLFRDAEDHIVALLDRCPHRSIPLSQGQVTPEGRLECAYHGWQFDSNGSCTRVPLNSLKPTQLSKLSAISFPTRTIAGLIWVFTGTENPPEPELPPSLLEAADRYVIYHEIWNGHWTRAIENSMDNVHVPFVHRNSFGGGMRDIAQSDAIVQVDITSTTTGMIVNNRIDTKPFGLEIEWYQPNCIVDKFDLMGIPLRTHIFAIPINDRQMRFMQVILPSPGIDRTNFDFDGFVASAIEDRVIIEAQKGEVPNTTGECNVPTDEPSLRFRRWYYRVVKNIG
jgi:phenylpropionate dioxygenase-like ring-hydroxylating dioxygenase large terminal subunit